MSFESQSIYFNLLTIPSIRMADFSSTYGPPSDHGGYMLSEIRSLYKSLDLR
jgi:hypothetical protein